MVMMQTFPMHGKCIPKPSSTLNVAPDGKQKLSISDKLYGRVAQLIIKNWFRDYTIDILNGWAILLCCGALAGLLFTLIWIGALRSRAKQVIWSSLVLVNIMAFIYMIFRYMKAGVLKSEGAAIGQDLVHKLKDAPSGLDVGAMTGRSPLKWYGHVMADVLIALVIYSVVVLRGLNEWIDVAAKCMDLCGEAIDAVQSFGVTQSLVYVKGAMSQSPVGPTSTVYQGVRGVQAPKTPNAIPLPNQRIKPGPIDLLWGWLVAPFVRPLLLITLPVYCFTVACWLSVLMFIISMCSIQQQSNGAFGFVWTWKFYVMVVYHSFGLMWAWQTINGVNVMVVAGSVSYYYWHRDKASPSVWQVLLRALRFNCGSAIFGGLFFAPGVLVLQGVCSYINQVIGCVQLCGRNVPERLRGSVNRSLTCIDNIISYFNKDALVLVAIKGKDYCTSACMARGRIKANAALMYSFSVSPELLLFIGKVLVCFTCAISSLTMSQLPLYSDMSSSTYIASPIFLMFMTTSISYAIAHTLLEVYRTTWDALMLNVCEDCERHHGMLRSCPQLLIEAVQMSMEMKAKTQINSLHMKGPNCSVMVGNDTWIFPSCGLGALE